MPKFFSFIGALVKQTTITGTEQIPLLDVDGSGVTEYIDIDQLDARYPIQFDTDRNLQIGYDDNSIAAGTDNVILGGGRTSNLNTITGTDELRTIVGGYNNTIGTAIASACVTTQHGVIADAADHAVIVGGSNHTIDDGAYGAIIGGTMNTTEAARGVVVGGEDNFLYGRSSVTAGEENVCGTTGTTRSDYAALFGGYQSNLGTTASARFSGVVGGRGHSVQAEYGGIVGGKDASITNKGTQAWANGMFATVGDAQAVRGVLKRQTTNATATQLLSDTGYMVLPTDTTWAFSIMLAARRTDADNESAGYKFEGVIDNNAGTVALVGTVATTVLAEDNAGWNAVLSADDSNNALRIIVTGEASKTINWVATYDITSVSG